MFAVTQVQEIDFSGRRIYVKRDDLIHPQFSGNKARKFQYFLTHEFPNITKLVGYGSAQANSLFSLAVLAKLKGWKFDYYVSHISDYLLKHPQGNYLAALESGANIIPLDRLFDGFQDGTVPEDAPVMAAVTQYLVGIDGVIECGAQANPLPKLETFMAQLAAQAQEYELFIPEGGRCEYAQEGVETLAEEILQWTIAQQLERLIVFFPSGTGTTAVYLQQYFNRNASRQGLHIEVHTCSCVGGDEYLLAQFTQLCPQLSHYPKILNTGKKYHFGKLYLDCYRIWQRVCKAGIEFELLYDPIGFLVLEQALQHQYTPKDTILYLHQGGVLGNPSMLGRYQRKYPQA
ncbi:1-aminocyclopropane-1-carboxylate deaminase/D-cysteine desulfhydrase [Shewanella sp. SR44-3]|uniref:1-aminocyclopropane-1-carboxylate deaminase/D-cysteine desulfhydrase n=1 Tax=Shewanella sp. SR44-3 TaxID=2760936 RepID=UPI0015FD8FD8|nr:1-aminocyclopropane-1-carboxylate deaminase/D-cysteine desulfhydrase [Shewanella sp. SR44-3]MBB1268012.1 1-aminocyclopropane-1-carboxylate deaminase/D-cysteine desulfhydrase [Shewanella sp. SR44-3]